MVAFFLNNVLPLNTAPAKKAEPVDKSIASYSLRFDFFNFVSVIFSEMNSPCTKITGV